MFEALVIGKFEEVEGSVLWYRARRHSGGKLPLVCGVLKSQGPEVSTCYGG